ncbi:N-acyl homoserine lactonase family protein [Chitinophaga sp. XS-30]|uniref:N-acyl homoserine lactonase family protein n=1 Tax=Chitinophaga sp. XS-30 TaxID=2604421 RepID=UPI0011DE5019|nr:N-acyl homoserine lactonase family protein [Chitinophaga sp. XS-30]QEH43450.1 N-acyl homoserine lactonase family protein [Chitinophaga sp. XS-30]
MKLYVLYAGDIICRDISQLNDGFPDKGEIELANPVFLVQHPKGWLLWDAGLSDELVHRPEGVEAWIFHLKMKRTVLEQLHELGVAPDDIDYFAFSHVHNDHTGNARYFKSARLIMQEKEYDLAFHQEKKPHNFGDYEVLKQSEAIKLNGDFDLFGDGAIRFISTPGHTPGHQSLLLKLKETGYVLISGDISYYADNYQKKGVPVFNTNKEDSLASIEKVGKLVELYQAQLWIQHDKARFDTLKLSPEYYQ